MVAAATIQSTAVADAQICASDRIKGFLGTTEEMTSVAETLAPHSVEWVKSLSDAELLPLGEKALHDIADDILVLDEIRQRFRKGLPILGYQNWREFIAKNSRYSMRTIQNRLAEKNGKDESRVNHRFESPAWAQNPVIPVKPVMPAQRAESEQVERLEQVNPDIATRVRAGTLVPRPIPQPTRRSYSERDYFARIGRGLCAAFSGVDARLTELTHLKKSEWTPEAEEGIRCLILNLKDVSSKADGYAVKLKTVLKRNGTTR
jgi:hypothetical protein